MIERSYLTTSQAAELLGLHESRVRQLLQAGQLRGTKLGRNWLVQRRAAEKMAQARAVAVDTRSR